MINNRHIINTINNYFDNLANYLLDDYKWSKIVRRTILSFLFLAFLTTLQTTIVYSPDFLVSALYHGRGIGVPTVIKMEKQKSEKLLDRLYGLYIMYHGKTPVKQRNKNFHLP